MEFLQNIRQNLFNTSANQPQQGQGSTFLQRLQDPRFLGLLAGAAATQRLGAAQGLQEGARVMAAYQGLDEERKRKALVQDLVSKGGFTPQEQALILASQNPAAVAAQIRAQKAAAANRPKQATFSLLSTDEKTALGFKEGDIVQRNDLTQGIDVIRSAPKPDQPKEKFRILTPAETKALNFAPGTVVEKNTVTNDFNVVQSPQETQTTFSYLTKAQKRNLGFDENSIVQVNNQSFATKLIKEAPKENETFKILSPEEIKNANFKEGTIVQQSNLSKKFTVLEQAPNEVSTRKTLTKAELLAEGFNEDDVVQRDEITQALLSIEKRVMNMEVV